MNYFLKIQQTPGICTQSQELTRYKNVCLEQLYHLGADVGNFLHDEGGHDLWDFKRL